MFNVLGLAKIILLAGALVAGFCKLLGYAMDICARFDVEQESKLQAIIKSRFASIEPWLDFSSRGFCVCEFPAFLHPVEIQEERV